MFKLRCYRHGGKGVQYLYQSAKKMNFAGHSFSARMCQTFLLINWTDNNYIVLPITSLKTKNLKMWSWLAQNQNLPAWGYSAYVRMYSTNLIL